MHLEPDLVKATWEYHLPALTPYCMGIEPNIEVPYIPESDLYILASSEDSKILQYISMLPNIPLVLLEEIFQYFIDTREGLIEGTSAFDIECGLARNSSLPFEYFFQLSIEDNYIQRLLEDNEATPPEIIHAIYELRESEAQFNEDMGSNYAWNSSSRYINSAEEQFSRYSSSGKRIQKAIKTEDDARRFATYLENLTN